MNELYHGDCIEVLRTMRDSSVDAVVTDPPYGLSFMGKKWDYDVPSEDIWRECLRVLKPGGHLLAFAGTRTQHRMAVRIEDAGFEIRDMIAWVYGSGFPKSLDVSKAIDKAAGAEREVVGLYEGPDGRKYAEEDRSNSGKHGWGAGNSGFVDRIEKRHVTAPATEAAKQWQGWGTALKPALEPITVARKPLIGTVAANVLAHGTGGINVDGCRVEGAGAMKWETPRGGIWSTDSETTAKLVQNTQGRWPANLIHDGSDEVVGLFPPSAANVGTYRRNQQEAKVLGGVRFSSPQIEGAVVGYGDSGSAARFFYCPKCSKKDRNEGLPEGVTSTHPTVKPTDLMRYLCRLVTPPGGIVLDPFMGSGSTGKAAILEGFQFIGIERDAEYIEIAKARINHRQEK